MVLYEVLFAVWEELAFNGGSVEGKMFCQRLGDVG